MIEASEDACVRGPRVLEERLGGKNAESGRARDDATCESVMRW